MFGSQILEVFAGIIFVFIIVSVIATAVREGIEGWLKMRAGFLEYGIREILHSKKTNGLADSLYTHPLIYGLFSDGFKPKYVSKPPSFFSSLFSRKTNLPSYIPAANFATALMDIAARGPVTNSESSPVGTTSFTAATIRANILNLNNEPVQRILLTALDAAQDDLAKATSYIEGWYNSGMERVSGWYKRSTQGIIFWISLFVAVALNINSITIAEFLYRNGAVRAAVVKRAETVAAASNGNHGITYEQALEDINRLELPIGWRQEGVASIKKKIFSTETGPSWFLGGAAGFGLVFSGWLLTALAAMLGAPFWFDMLNKIMDLRSTVKPREKSGEEKPKDSVARLSSVSGAGANVGGAHLTPAHPGPVPQLPIPRLSEEEHGIDALDIENKEETPDEKLPIAEGGVA